MDASFLLNHIINTVSTLTNDYPKDSLMHIV